MEHIEPIDLLKERLALYEKAINKSTVSTYNQVSTNLNPWIAKYKKAIMVLNQRHGYQDNTLLELDETTPILTELQKRKLAEWPCNNCDQSDMDYCMNICPIKKEKPIQDEPFKFNANSTTVVVDILSLKRHVEACIRNGHNEVAIRHISEYLNFNREEAVILFNRIYDYMHL